MEDDFSPVTDRKIQISDKLNTNQLENDGVDLKNKKWKRTNKWEEKEKKWKRKNWKSNSRIKIKIKNRQNDKYINVIR